MTRTVLTQIRAKSVQKKGGSYQKVTVFISVEDDVK